MKNKTNKNNKTNIIMADKYKLINNKLNNDKAGFVIVISLIAILIIISAAFIYAAETSLQANVIVLGNVSFITINSPVDEQLYNTKSIFLDIKLSEKVKYLYYRINSGSYNKLCSNCDKYSAKKGFSEGENNLTILAIKYDNTKKYSAITFYIDTTKPKILDTFPDKYGKGLFGVKYTESNLQKVTLYYWPATNSSDINTKLFLSCLPGTNIWCSDFIDISSYNNKYIYYKFELKDNFFSVNSSVTKILIDTISPVLNVFNPVNSSVYVNSKGQVYLNISSSEKAKLEYKDNNLSWIQLCSSCTSWKGYKTFSFGQHNVSFKATDLAGNYDKELTSFILRQY